MISFTVVVCIHKLLMLSSNFNLYVFFSIVWFWWVLGYTFRWWSTENLDVDELGQTLQLLDAEIDEANMESGAKNSHGPILGKCYFDHQTSSRLVQLHLHQSSSPELTARLIIDHPHRTRCACFSHGLRKVSLETIPPEVYVFFTWLVNSMARNNREVCMFFTWLAKSIARNNPAASRMLMN